MRCGITRELLLGLLLLPRPWAHAAAQVAGCDTVIDYTYHYVDTLYTTIVTDSATDGRDLLGIPLLTADQVGFVTDSTTCQQAAAAYTLAEGDSVANRRVYVFRLGSTRYLVVDRTKHGGEWLIAWLFDSAFTPLSRLGT